MANLLHFHQSESTVSPYSRVREVLRVHQKYGWLGVREVGLAFPELGSGGLGSRAWRQEPLRLHRD